MVTRTIRFTYTNAAQSDPGLAAKCGNCTLPQLNTHCSVVTFSHTSGIGQKRRWRGVLKGWKVLQNTDDNAFD